MQTALNPFTIYYSLFTTLALALALLLAPAASAQTRKAGARYGAASAARDRAIAARFAPVFHQGLGDDRRGDLITSFDFDGDWRGDNNWRNASDTRFRARAFVYYAVSETPTHLFVHYAVFHPRDYKGGTTRGQILSGVMREGVRRGGRYDPTGVASGVVLAHENDMEGCLVVAEKDGGELERARVVYVETLGHDRFQKYSAAETQGARRVGLEGQRPLLYIEPKGHGVSAYDAADRETARVLVYRYAGRADDAGAAEVSEAGYDLLPLYTTLWPRARRGAGETFGEAFDYGTLSVSVVASARGKPVRKSARVGKLGAAFRGVVGAENMARPPWGWFDRDEREAAPGSWFFDPATTVKRHFKLGEGFSDSYLHAPFLGVFRQ